MDALTRRQFDRAMFAKERTLAIRVGDYASRDIKEASFEYGYIKGDTYKPGGTCAGSGKITFTSIITTFNKLDILHPEIGLLVGDTYQWVKMGEYFINDIEIDRNRNTTTLELMDGMFKLNREYVTDLHFPAEVREVIQEICLKTGIELANDYFGISAMRYHVEQVPEGKKLSFRDMLSAMTQMIGMSCFFNREGKMEIRDLTESNITINADSYFLHGLTKSEIEYQIAGITCKTDKKSLTVGMKTGRSLEMDNVFMTQSALNDLYYKLKNLTYYPYNLNYQGHLLLEVGQWVTIQTNKKETFKVPVLSQSFTFKGGLRGRISADSKAGNDTQYSYEGTITKQIKQQDGIEAKIQAQIEAADAAFEAEFEKRKKVIDDAIEKYKENAEEFGAKIHEEMEKERPEFVKRIREELMSGADSIAELSKKLEQVSETARVNASLIGGDGNTQYNKNRLNGGTAKKISYGTDFVEVGHNGEGFEIGKKYVISWSATCTPYGKTDVTVVVNKTPFYGGHVHLAPANSVMPAIDKDLTQKEEQVLAVYYGAYRLTFSGDWYQNVEQSVTIDNQTRRIELAPVYKTVADGQHARYDGSWNQNPTFIFDGGRT
ncbi:pblB [Streptococcus sp. Marseille-Q5855]|uniref:pblB n=1 Tax=Streptococcus sp. Marseille-Q5855 TaxID=2972781 RepID=UPI0029161979|nr:pblB [Streptococcus sp. Marseille-Q5855]